MTNRPSPSLLRRALIAAGLLGAALGAGAQSPQSIVYWYHFDNPEQTKVMDALVADFQAKNPGIKVDAQNIPWNNYYDRLFTAIAGGKAPDAAMVKLQSQAQLVEMGALEPIDARIANWPGRADLGDNLLNLNKGGDGKQYYLPLQYVVIYLYYRTDLFQKAGLQPPATCEAFVEAARKLTLPASANGGTPQYGFGMRGGRGGQDNWGPFVLSQVAMTPAELASPKAVAANQLYVDLMRTHKAVPPSAPNDGFNEIINGFKSGQTAMIFHHIGSSKTMHDTHGDKVSAVPVPACGGKRWTSFGDESNAMFAQSRNKDATWKWISYLSEREGNVKFVGATGQMTVTKSGVPQVSFQPRFAKATADSLPFAAILPPVPQTSDFVSNVWPTNMQRALNGEITSAQMMEAIAKHYASK
jgi:multiple sugar transport system substrate-binding protein